MKKLFAIFSWGVVLSIYTIILVGAFWEYYPYKIFEVKDVKIVTPVVKAGHDVEYLTTACKYKNIPAEVSKFLVNDVFIPFTPYTAQTFTGCVSKTVTSIIPEFVDEGIYHIRIVSEFKVNPIRTISVIYDTPSFRVIK